MRGQLILPQRSRTAPQAYRIGVGDKIGVVVIGQPDLSGEATVDQSGNLRLPVVGDIHAANLTPSELEKSIGQSLEQGYVRRPKVSVKITEFRPIYVLGMVRTPGLYPFQQGQSVLAAIRAREASARPNKAAWAETCSRWTNVFACWKSAVRPSLQNRRG